MNETNPIRDNWEEARERLGLSESDLPNPDNTRKTVGRLLKALEKDGLTDDEIKWIYEVPPDERQARLDQLRPPVHGSEG